MKLTTEEAKAYHPKVWQDCLKAARRDLPRKTHNRVVEAWTEEAVNKAKKRADAYEALRERGIEEGWLIWSGGYDDGSYVVNVPEPGTPIETVQVPETDERYEARVKKAAGKLFKDILDATQSVADVAKSRLGLGGDPG